ncbi:MAG: hypothetical protein HRT61_03900 [Ekhidna sp.]|nr:hypothetical protein [Ekhidna sp.]
MDVIKIYHNDIDGAFQDFQDEMEEIASKKSSKSLLQFLHDFSILLNKYESVVACNNPDEYFELKEKEKLFQQKYPEGTRLLKFLISNTVIDGTSGKVKSVAPTILERSAFRSFILIIQNFVFRNSQVNEIPQLPILSLLKDVDDYKEIIKFLTDESIVKKDFSIGVTKKENTSLSDFIYYLNEYNYYRNRITSTWVEILDKWVDSIKGYDPKAGTRLFNGRQRDIERQSWLKNALIKLPKKSFY